MQKPCNIYEIFKMVEFQTVRSRALIVEQKNAKICQILRQTLTGFTERAIKKPLGDQAPRVLGG